MFQEEKMALGTVLMVILVTILGRQRTVEETSNTIQIIPSDIELMVTKALSALITWINMKRTINDKTLIIWVLLTAIVGSTASIQKGDETLSFKEQGIVLTPNNYVISGTSKIFTSLFVKIKDPLTDDQEAKMLCVSKNCTVPDSIYLQYLDRTSKPCVFEGLNEHIQLIDSLPGLTFSECVATCFVNPECQAVQWTRDKQRIKTSKCLIRRDPVDTQRLVINDADTLVDLEVDIACLERNISRAQLCGQTKANLYTLLKNARAKAIEEVWSENIRRFEDLKSAYEIQIENSNTTRKKRNPMVIALAGVGVVGMLSSFASNFLNRHEIKRLQTHVNSLDQRFSEFTQEVHGEFTRQREFNKDVLYLLKDYQQDTDSKLKSISCDISTLSTYAIQQHLFNEYREKVSQLFRGVNTGTLNMPISPAILSAEDLRFFTQSNHIFNNSIYTTNSQLLLRTGDITLVRIQRIKDAYVAHFVLSTMFVEQNAVFRLFEPAIVPVKTNDICLKINLPKRIYLKENLFHTAENSDCTNRPSGLLICLDDFKKDTKPPLVDCLNNGTGCTTQEVDCQPEVTQVSAGALVFRNSHPVYGIDKRQAGHLIRLDQPEVQTELYSWRKYSQIQVAHRVIYGIQTESTNNLISWNAQFDTTKWVKQLREKALLHEKSNLTRIDQLIKQQDEKLNITISKAEKFEGNGALFQLVQISAFGSVILWLITIIYLFCRRNNKYRQTIREMRETVSTLSAMINRPRPYEREVAEVSYRRVQEDDREDHRPIKLTKSEISPATTRTEVAESIVEQTTPKTTHEARRIPTSSPKTRIRSPSRIPKPKTPLASTESTNKARKTSNKTPASRSKTLDDLLKKG